MQQSAFSAAVMQQPARDRLIKALAWPIHHRCFANEDANLLDSHAWPSLKRQLSLLVNYRAQKDGVLFKTQSSTIRWLGCVLVATMCVASASFVSIDAAVEPIRAQVNGYTATQVDHDKAKKFVVLRLEKVSKVMRH